MSSLAPLVGVSRLQLQLQLRIKAVLLSYFTSTTLTDRMELPNQRKTGDGTERDRDKPEMYTKEGNETSEEREMRLERMRDRQAAGNSERDRRLQQTMINQHAKLVVESQTPGEITLQQRSTNQHEWLAVETPEERELRFGVKVQGAENNSLCCHNSH